MKLCIFTFLAVVLNGIFVDSIDVNSTKTIDKCQHDSCHLTFAVNFNGKHNIKMLLIYEDRLTRDSIKKLNSI